MSVIVCRQKRAANPYYIEGLGINIYSAQELCYAVYHHPLLFTDGFVDGELLEFVREELGMGFAAARLEQRQKSGDRSEELLFQLMQECDYYTTVELNRLRQTFAALKKLPPLEYAKEKADYLAEYKQYGKAIAGYEEILEAADEKKDIQVTKRIWNNLGACYARIFRFRKAMDAYDKACKGEKDVKILEKMYYLTCLDSSVGLKEPYRSMVSEEMKQGWDKEFQTAQVRAEESAGLKKLQTLFGEDSVRRMEGAGRQVEEWKQEYRSMA